MEENWLNRRWRQVRDGVSHTLSQDSRWQTQKTVGTVGEILEFQGIGWSLLPIKTSLVTTQHPDYRMAEAL